MSDDNLITLKEAASLSGYTSDYIGQLIRSGKIPGKQVYTGITWMTTAEAVLDYKNAKNGKDDADDNVGFFGRQKRRVIMEFDIMRLFFRTFSSALPVSIFIVVCVFILFLFMSYILVTNKFSQVNHEIKSSIETELTY